MFRYLFITNRYYELENSKNVLCVPQHIYLYLELFIEVIYYNKSSSLREEVKHLMRKRVI